MSEPEKNIQEHIKRTLAGENEYFRQVVDLYKDGVFNILYRMTGDRHDAEDISQEAFIRAFEKLSAYDSGQSFKNWLFTIAVNLCRNHLRRKRLVKFIPFFNKEGLNEPADQGSDPSEIISKREDEEKLRFFAGKLPEKTRIVFLLRYAEDLSYQDISRITGFPLGTVETCLHRAKKYFAENTIKSEISA